MVAVAGQVGRWVALLDVANHFAPLWGAFGLICAAACGLAIRGRARRLGLGLGLLAAAVAGALIAPELVAGASDRGPAAGPTLKVVQFNLWGRNVDSDRTTAWILAQKADVVMTEETFGKAFRIGKALRRAYPYWSGSEGPRRGSVMVFSRWPIVERGRGDGPPTAWATVDWRGRPATLLAIHDYWPYPPGIQQWQLGRLAGFINGRDQRGIILAGDFNAAPWSFSLKRLDRAITLQRRTHGAPTWPAASVSRFHIPTLFPVLAIDQVYAGPGWRTVSVTRGPRLGSDHHPVVVVLTAAD